MIAKLYYFFFYKKTKQNSHHNSKLQAAVFGWHAGKGLGSRDSACSLYTEEEEKEEVAGVMPLRNSCSDPKLIGN